MDILELHNSYRNKARNIFSFLSINQVTLANVLPSKQLTFQVVNLPRKTIDLKMNLKIRKYAICSSVRYKGNQIMDHMLIRNPQFHHIKSSQIQTNQNSILLF